jgi:hypothetical protein
MINIDVAGLPGVLVGELKDNMMIQLNKEGFVLGGQDKAGIRSKCDKTILQFTIRAMMQTDLIGDVFLSPF